MKEIGESYALVQLSVPLQELHILKIKILPCVADIPSIAMQNDGSFEIVARKMDLPVLRNAVRKLFLNALLYENHDPLNPTSKDLASCGLLSARRMAGTRFYTRALEIIRTDNRRAAAYYQYMLDINGFKRT